MIILVKAFLAMMFVCLISVQSVSAQEKGPCTDPDLPGETESPEEDSDDKKEDAGEPDVQKDDNGDYWWNDNGDIKRVWPKDHPDAPWNRVNKSTSADEDLDQANPNDSPGPYTDDAILIDIMLVMMDYSVDADEALEMLLSGMFDPNPRDEAIAIPNLLTSDGKIERDRDGVRPHILHF